MHSASVDRHAALLLDYCAEVRAGQVVSLNLPTPAQPLARALTRGVLERGGRPVLHLTYAEWSQDWIECAAGALLDEAPSLELAEMEHVDAWIGVDGPANTRGLQDADPARRERFEAWRRPVNEARLRGTRWVRSLHPTAAGAQDAGTSLDAFEHFVYDAMHLFDDDPAARWRELREEQARLVARLSRCETLQLVGPGTDLTLRVAGRTWMNSAGERNMPSGEVFTGPVEDSAEGHVTFDVPSFLGGVEVRGVRLRFERGEVVEATAERGEAALHERLARDSGARRLGEVGIGTNRRIRRAIGHTLFDEKIGGTVHLALGRSYPETGGRNESAIHWDLICDLRAGGELRADGASVQRDGAFVVGDGA